jgi:hypothetical protein
MNGMARGGDLGLVERYGNYLVAGKVADIADLHNQVVARLPLEVQHVVDGIGKLVPLGIGGNGGHLPTVPDLVRRLEIVG